MVSFTDEFIIQTDRVFGNVFVFSTWKFVEIKRFTIMQFYKFTGKKYEIYLITVINDVIQYTVNLYFYAKYKLCAIIKRLINLPKLTSFLPAIVAKSSPS